MMNDKATSTDIAEYIRDQRHRTCDGRSEDGFDELMSQDEIDAASVLRRYEGFDPERSVWARKEPQRSTWAFVVPLAALGFLALWLIVKIRDAMHVYGTSGGAW